MYNRRNSTVRLYNKSKSLSYNYSLTTTLTVINFNQIKF